MSGTVQTPHELVRAHVEDVRRQQADADAERTRRVAAILASLPSLLASEMPAVADEWVGTLLIGIMYEYGGGREERVHRAEWETLHARTEGLLDRVRYGEAEPDDIRRAVALTRAEVAEANRALHARIPDYAEAVANYIGGHMRLRFRPHGRTRLKAVVAAHLEALCDRPMPRTLERERRLGELKLACADEFDAERARGARPGAGPGIRS